MFFLKEKLDQYVSQTIYLVYKSYTVNLCFTYLSKMILIFVPTDCTKLYFGTTFQILVYINGKRKI